MTRNKIIIATLIIVLAAMSLALLLSPTGTKGTDPFMTEKNIKGSVPFVHYSTLMGKEFFDRAYTQAPTIVKTDSPIAGGTVNHHLLAAPLDAQFFEGLAAQKPKRVILIGPDHMSRGRQTITTTAGTWRTPYGDLTIDTALINELAGKKIANIEESPFDFEFSVGGLVPFIKRSLPQVKTITIIVRSDATEEQLKNLSNALPRDNDTVVVASIDFSHYLPSRAADFHDLTNRAVINAFDYSNFDKLEIDSVPSLRVLLKYLEQRGAQKATLVANTDSAKITGKLDTQETTSYLNQYFSIGRSAPTGIETSLYIPPGKKIVSAENRFMHGFMESAVASDLPQYLQLPNLAVGMAASADKITYFLFPTATDKAGTRLMTAAEEKEFFRQNGIKESIITVQN